ncbi:MAG: hypothetical protein NTU94_18185 [Planctomycetota bacterium]|nr:hypothetical protein [Planctomycetota bacterium]
MSFCDFQITWPLCLLKHTTLAPVVPPTLTKRRSPSTVGDPALPWRLAPVADPFSPMNTAPKSFTKLVRQITLPSAAPRH